MPRHGQSATETCTKDNEEHSLQTSLHKKYFASKEKCCLWKSAVGVASSPLVRKRFLLACHSSGLSCITLTFWTAWSSASIQVDAVGQMFLHESGDVPGEAFPYAGLPGLEHGNVEVLHRGSFARRDGGRDVGRHLARRQRTKSQDTDRSPDNRRATPAQLLSFSIAVLQVRLSCNVVDHRFVKRNAHPRGDVPAFSEPPFFIVVLEIFFSMPHFLSSSSSTLRSTLDVTPTFSDRNLHTLATTHT